MSVESSSQSSSPLSSPTPTLAAPAAVDTARVVVAAVETEHVEITLPGTSYRLRLVCADAESLRARIGRRVDGRIEGNALRMHVTSAGGRFIEPSEGTPRIVQGAVQAVERGTTADGEGVTRVLVDMAVPVWVRPLPGQCFREMALGDLVNFYMQSGTRFTPI